MTPGDARRARRVDLERRRFDEARCSWDYLRHGHDEHAKRCVRTPPCSREYDPGPPPAKRRIYQNTGIGLLYGLNEAGALSRYGWAIDDLSGQLAGWDITRKKGNA
jgi:hypothetical protein